MDRYCEGCGRYLPAVCERFCDECEHRLNAVPGPPRDLPDAFWLEPGLAAALAQRHMGRVIRAYRRHPHHGRRHLPQEVVAEWCGITQAQLSRVENGPPLAHMDRLVHWARLLCVPQQYLWFHLPTDTTDEVDVKRAEFLRLGAVAAATAAVGVPVINGEEAAQSLAWELWQRNRTALHPTELPTAIAALLPRIMGGASCIVLDSDGCVTLAHPSLIDFFVAQRIFGCITAGDSSLFASAQTRHDTDQVLRRFVMQNSKHMETLASWMGRATDPVLRVNSAGVLGKVGSSQATTQVIETLRVDVDTRQLYVTAVASRVLGIDWDIATGIAVDIERSCAPTRWTPTESEVIGGQLADETLNPRDGAARWCSLVLLGHLGVRSQRIKETLGRALKVEQVPSNLRALGCVLAGSTPLAV